MRQLTFDTLEYANTLEKGGFTKSQAQALAVAQKQAMNEMVAAKDLATRADLLEVKKDLQIEMANLKSDLIKWFMGTTLPLLAVMIAGFALVISSLPH